MKMNQPSEIKANLTIKDGLITAVQVGGSASDLEELIIEL